MMIRSNFSDFTLEDALPVLKKVTDDTYATFAKEYEKLFNIGSMDRGIIQSSQVSGIPALGQVSEGAEYPTEQMYQGYDKTYTAVKYGCILPISEELLEDAMVNVFEKRGKQLAMAMDEAEKILAASIFNNAFSSAGPDGVALIHASHPLIYPGAGTSSNVLGTPADLSQSALEDLVTVLRNTKDGAGKKIFPKGKTLVVPPDLEFLAHELIDSKMKPQATDNGTISEVNMPNVVSSRYGLEVCVLDHLTDADGYFLLADKAQHDLNWYWRKKPITEGDVEFKSDVLLMKIKARFINGFGDWRGIAGTPGA